MHHHTQVDHCNLNCNQDSFKIENTQDESKNYYSNDFSRHDYSKYDYQNVLTKNENLSISPYKSASTKKSNLDTHASCNHADQAEYRVFVPSKDELKNLIPSHLLSSTKKAGDYLFTIQSTRFHFLRDNDGNTYAQSDGDLMPLHKFMNSLKSDSPIKPFQMSPTKQSNKPMREVYH